MDEKSHNPAVLPSGERLTTIVGLVCRGLWQMDEGGSRNGLSLSEEAHCEGRRGRAPLLGTLGYERKALGTGISPHWGSIGQYGLGSSTGDFERWLKGAPELRRLPLWELCEGKLKGGLPCWVTWRIGRKGYGDGRLFPYEPCWGTWKQHHLPGTLRDEWRGL